MSAQQPLKAPEGPLNGVTIIDLGQVYNGPYCTFLLAMAGANVIKVEPVTGENLRRRAEVGGAALPFAMLNSNKNFVSLNLKNDAGKQLLRDMVKKGDVLVENFSPGAMDRLGLGYEKLKEINPRIIYASGSGYGLSGRMRNYPAMDITVQAMSGVMSINGFPDRPPVKAGPALCDFLGGIHLYAGIVSALYERERTGHGQLVEVAMMEATFPTLASNLGLHYGTKGTVPPRTGNRHGGMAEAPYNVYPATDGFIAVLCASDAKWEKLLDVIGRPELKGDARFSTLKARVAHIDDVDEIVGGFTSKLSRQQAFQKLAGEGITCAPVRDLNEVVNDAHMLERGALAHVHHPMYGDMVLMRSALRFSGDPLPDIVPSGEIGRDNEAVYCGWLGISQGDLERFEREGVV
jgi:crotonobetainyl-CoA:carnitine CoA-transferase CaiB-like acyl-CoA transferase